MKVKAKHWLNMGGTWRKAGEVFEVENIEGIEKSVEVIETKGAKAQEKPVEVVAEPVVKPDEPKKEATKSTAGTTAKRRTRTSK